MEWTFVTEISWVEEWGSVNKHQGLAIENKQAEAGRKRQTQSAKLIFRANSDNRQNIISTFFADLKQD